jgi:hypothetical protein
MPITRSSARKLSTQQHKSSNPTTASTVTNTTKTTTNKKTKHYTHLNSDKHCLQDPKSFWQVAFYRLQLYNGLYMLDRSEQVFLYSLAFIVFALVSWYGYAFLHGLVDGWNSAATGILK